MDQVWLNVNQSILAQSGSWYRNLQYLGGGGNASTFLVVATSGPFRGVPFAAKIFRKLSKPERRASFFQEAEFLKRCSHPSVMKVFDSGEFRDSPFLIAEYLPLTLDLQMRAPGLSLVNKISYSLQLLSALEYLKGLDPRVIHRDIKPQNIFVKGRSCVLGDFGLMKSEGGPVDEDREVLKESLGVGMPRSYRTPDQVDYLLNKRDLTVASDVFQLGLVLAELFTGRNPERPAGFQEPVELEVLRRVPGSFGDNIRSILQRMLEFDPEKRPYPDQLQGAWEGLFKGVVSHADALEGRVF